MKKNQSLSNQKLNYINDFVNPQLNPEVINSVGDSINLAEYRKVRVDPQLFIKKFSFMGQALYKAWTAYLGSTQITVNKVPTSAQIQTTIETFGVMLLQKNAHVFIGKNDEVNLNHEGLSKLLLKVFSFVQLQDSLNLLIYNWHLKIYQYVNQTQILAKAIAAIMNTIKPDSWNSQSETRVIKLVERSLRPIALEEFDKTYACFGGKLIDLRTLGDGGAADPKKLVLVHSDVKYNALADCPQFKAFLDTNLSDKDKQAFVQEFSGYLLDPNYSAHVFLIIYGVGRNGKSVYLDLMTRLLNPIYVSSASLETLDSTFGLAPLVGMRANISNEGAAVKFETKNLKSITGGNPVQIDAKNQQQYSTILKVKLIFATNNLPTTSDMTMGFSRRLNILPFNYQVPKQMQDPDLTQKLATELPGILNWAIEGLKRLRANNYRFTQSDSMLEAKDRYLLFNHPVTMFVKQCLVPDENSKIPLAQLNGMYEHWLAQRNIASRGTTNNRIFSKELGQAFEDVFALEVPFVKMHGNVKGLSGYRVKVEKPNE
ncbi:phage/plasmid primase, P4 family [Lactiplantibacillus plantarum]|uniref:DNA primase family protein n=1 Tax=Lactiplantibacillus plantarum TaxID=1590 RepID=UPI0013D25895|nr:phage/plasmid primase, P4 family [Lactiplantibacillus plantarum]